MLYDICIKLRDRSEPTREEFRALKHYAEYLYRKNKVWSRPFDDFFQEFLTRMMTRRSPLSAAFIHKQLGDIAVDVLRLDRKLKRIAYGREVEDA